MIEDAKRKPRHHGIAPSLRKSSEPTLVRGHLSSVPDVTRGETGSLLPDEQFTEQLLEWVSKDDPP
jgi:hypothetical protein